MKRKITFSGILHNDRLVLIISLVLAIFVWSAVVYGPGNEQERTISGVPVTVTLGDYASTTKNMQIVDGQDLTATVRVYGRRAVVEQLTAQDILLTVDTSTVLNPGSYSKLNIKATKNGKRTDFEILSIEPFEASLVCDVWVEASFDIKTNIPNITASDESKYQIGIPLVSGDSVVNGQVKITGPQTEVNRIAYFVATTDAKQALSQTAVFDANIKAVDKDGNEVDISHCTLEGESAAVKVTVPVLVYKRLDLRYTIQNLPKAYEGKENLVTFTPSYLELWGDEQAISKFEKEIEKLCTFNFDNLSTGNLTQEKPLNIPADLKVLDGVDALGVKFNLGTIRTKTLSLTLSDSNVKVVNCPAGLSVTASEKTLGNIVVCGSRASINKITAKDLQLVLNVNNETALGQRTITSRISVPGYDDVWVYYGENATSFELLATVAKK